MEAMREKATQRLILQVRTGTLGTIVVGFIGVFLSQR